MSSVCSGSSNLNMNESNMNRPKTMVVFGLRVSSELLLGLGQTSGCRCRFGLRRHERHDVL